MQVGSISAMIYDSTKKQKIITMVLQLSFKSKDSAYVCGSCVTPLSTLHGVV